MKHAFITGITGQDGSYLTEFLLEKDYKVHGLIRRSSSPNTSRISHLLDDPRWKERLFLHEGDLGDSSNLLRIVEEASPDEIYNLAAMSHVKVSFQVPEYTGNIGALGTIRLLEIIRAQFPKARFYQASTSELFGKVFETPQTELTPFHPRSPYGVAKLYAYWACINYREAYDLYACNGILFNHESPRRGETFVPRKISLAVSRIKMGLQEELVLGNLDAKRDWGYARDFIEGMWLMLQQPKADDYLLATGKTTSVRRFVELAFQYIGIEIEWQGKGIDEVGIDRKSGKTLVRVSTEFFRPAEVDILLGNASKAKSMLGWIPQTSVENLVQIMVEADLKKCKSTAST
ncbi:MAG: GDP-mannose 4,6-dehydratase [Verrucomicrobia bacterium]|nr:GDP-mannose 4,6-dehydratase [Verrucomicrobiota bacterium]